MHKGLSTLLSATTVLEVLLLVMDEASIVETAPFMTSDTVDLWHQVFKIRFPRLQVLSLRGWEMHDTATVNFLSAHKYTLEDLRLGDCVVLGELKAVFMELLDSRNLTHMWLHQAGQNFHRVEFPTTCRAFARRVRDDWLWVSRTWCEVGIDECDHWRSKLEEIIQDIMVTSRLVDPRAWDAGYWD